MSVVSGEVQGVGFPDVPDLADTLGLLEDVYGFRIRGSQLKPVFQWVERRRELGVPGRSCRFVTELHIVLPHLNLHIIHFRSRWVIEGGGVKEFERVRFVPWAPYPGNVKDLVFGRWAD
jgi:hypothetical protein